MRINSLGAAILSVAVIAGCATGSAFQTDMGRGNHAKSDNLIHWANWPEAARWYRQAYKDAPDTAARNEASRQYAFAERMVELTAANPGPSGTDVLSALVSGAATGAQNGMAARAGRAQVSYTTPNPSPAAPGTTSGQYTYEPGLERCTRIVRDNKGGSIQNTCNVPVTVISFSSDADTGAETDISPGGSGWLSAMGFGQHGNILMATCPKGDYIEIPGRPGTQWGGSGSYTCRRP
jgi:hypothetical protein